MWPRTATGSWSSRWPTSRPGGAAAISGMQRWACWWVWGVGAVRAGGGGLVLWYAALGLRVGQRAGGLIPVITGLPPDTSEDELKALGAAAASSGAVALFHAVGITPEAPNLAAALGGRRPLAATVVVTRDALKSTRAALNRARAGDTLVAVRVGTPHFSLAEFAALEHELEIGRA